MAKQWWMPATLVHPAVALDNAWCENGRGGEAGGTKP
jgi:hypothetical protein